MKIDTAHVLGALKNEYAFGASSDVGRVFVTCVKCFKIVPYWRCVGKKSKRMGCACGASDVRPQRIPEWKAMYWVLVRSLIWRKWILRKDEWDARMPTRQIYGA